MHTHTHMNYCMQSPSEAELLVQSVYCNQW